MRRGVMGPVGRRLAGLAALATLVATAVGPASATAAVPVSGNAALAVTSSAVSGGRLDLVLTAARLPAGAVLDPTTVRVTVDGTPVRVSAGRGSATGQHATQVRAAVVVLDTSGSMAGARLGSARRLALDYARALPAGVLVGLVTAAAPARLVLSPTADRARLARALAALTAHGGTALYDAVTTASSALARAKAAAAPASRRLFVLTDGADTDSAASLGAATTAVRTGRIGVDVAAFGVAAADRGPLVELASAGGGSVRDTADAGSVAGAFGAAGSGSATLPLSVPLPGTAAGSVRVEVRVSAGGQWLTAGQDVVLPGAASSPAPSASPAAQQAGALPPTGGSSWQLWLFLALVFGALLGLGALVLVGGPAGGRRQRRVDQVKRYGLGRAPAPVSTERPVVRAALAGAAALARSRGMTERIGAELDRAGMPIRVQEWLVLRACSGVVVAAATGLLSHSALVGLVAGVLVGWWGGRLYLSVRAARRCAAFAEQLPDVLQLVASSLRSGFSLPQALEAVAREGSQPAAGEFTRALGEARLGAPLESALESAATRVRSRDLSWVVLAVRIQRRTGGNLAEVLVNTVHTMRDRAKIRRQVRALSAEGRISAYILVGLPVALGAWMFLIRRDYVRPLYTEPAGLMMLAGAAVLLVVGGFWMSRLVKVEV